MKTLQKVGTRLFWVVLAVAFIILRIQNSPSIGREKLPTSAPLIEKVRETPPKRPIATPTPPPPAPSTQTTSPPELENYQLIPCPDGTEGCYTIPNAPSESMTSAEELNAATNQYRQAHGFTKLYIDPQLCEIAAQRATEIGNSFSHDGFNQHIQNGDYDYAGFTSIAENLWQGNFSGVHIVEYGWDKSEGHRANLQGDWSRGCGEVNGSNAVFIFVR
ncbi:CAP domain-containing protein [Patescibacteria group bacterium]|nr:CAP domain-containing protein [Patescibacteria group bacterium]